MDRQRPNEPINVICITGGVLSGIGKGILASAIAMLLWALGVVCTYVKEDGYLNKTAGTQSPLKHGEVNVTEEGGETDLDLG